VFQARVRLAAWRDADHQQGRADEL
jgi:hypothetical protein